jgi:hypothetical protein
MGICGSSIQLFYLGALYLFGLPGLFDLRFHLAEPDHYVLVFILGKATNLVDPYGLWPKTIVDYDVAEAAADATAAPRRKSDSPAGIQSVSTASELNMVFSARRRGHNQVAFVQYPVVSDSPLKDAIRARRYLFKLPLGRLIIVPCTC